jgi:sugar fermentation stimulation protein A
MKFSTPLLPGRLVQRYKRFLADIILDTGEEIIAHCANSGSLLGLSIPQSRVYVSPAMGETRKLKYTWELVESQNTWVGINTSWPNILAQEAISQKQIPELSGYDSITREVKYGTNSRIDLLLKSTNKPWCYVEVKNVTLAVGESAQFPDAVTARGTKHLMELQEIVRLGHRAVMLYIVQRRDSHFFSLADHIDSVYAKTCKEALKQGVELLCYQCHVSPEEISIVRPLSIHI